MPGAVSVIDPPSAPEPLMDARTALLRVAYRAMTQPTDVTNTPGTALTWRNRYIEMIQTDPAVLEMREGLRRVDPTGTALINADAHGFVTYLALKREKGLVLPGEDVPPTMPSHLYE